MRRVFIIGVVCVGCFAGAGAGGVMRAREVKPEMIGEFVTVAGEVRDFSNPVNDRAPYSFRVVDGEKGSIRVVAWSPVFSKIDRHDELRTTGTRVRLAAEVAEYNDRIELHVQDYREVVIMTSGTLQGDEATTGTRAQEVN